MKSLTAAFILFFALVAPIFPLSAQQLDIPVLCEPGQDCWILSYPDMNGLKGVIQDYACGPGAIDNDMSLRIGLADSLAVNKNFFVLAAGDGVVRDTLDGIDDLVLAGKYQLPKGTPLCGNGIVIDHGMGLQTAYCHLRKGSIQVKKGDKVRKSQVIATVGQSGLATWPQLGFSVRKSGVFIDPITGMTQLEGCGFKPRPVIALPKEWRDYQPGAIVALGFSPAPITKDALVLGQAPRFVAIDRMEDTINMWALLINVRKGDEIAVRLRDPRGRTQHYADTTAEDDEDRQVINISRNRGYAGWQTGIWSGEITLTRMVENRPVTATRQVTVIVQ